MIDPLPQLDFRPRQTLATMALLTPEYWGYHLILDVRGCNRAAIADPERRARFVRTLVRDIDMKAYGEPVIEHFATHDPEKAGYSLVQLVLVQAVLDRSGEAGSDELLPARLDPGHLPDAASVAWRRGEVMPMATIGGEA